MVNETSVTGEGGEAPRQVVSRWFAAEAGKDYPFIPPDWPEPYWALLVEMYPRMRYWVAHQPYAPESVIRTLAKAGDWRVRDRVAMKRNLPADLFIVLASDPEPNVRKAVAANAKAPLDLVTQLADDPDAEVADIAIRNRDKRLQKSLRKKGGP